MTNFNQELFSNSKEEFKKGNIDKAWELALQVGDLKEGVFKQQWVNHQLACENELKHCEELGQNLTNLY